MKFKFSTSTKVQEVLTRLAKGGTGFAMNPLRDWTIGLGIAALVFFVGVSSIAYDFYTQLAVPDVEIVVEEKQVMYRERDVVHYAEEALEREKMFNMLREYRSAPVPTTAIESEVVLDSARTAPLADPGEEQYTEPTVSNERL